MASTDHFSAHQFAANQSTRHSLPTDRLPGDIRPSNGPGKVSETTDASSSSSVRTRAVMELAEKRFSETGSWVVFYREMFGKGGVVPTHFSEPGQLEAFRNTSAYAELQEMVAALRSHESPKGDKSEPERMITIRLPKSLHEALTTESNELNLSINKLCISKLLQRIESRFVPVQQGRRRGRRPGPQGPKKKTSQE